MINLIQQSFLVLEMTFEMTEERITYQLGPRKKLSSGIDAVMVDGSRFPLDRHIFHNPEKLVLHPLLPTRTKLYFHRIDKDVPVRLWTGLTEV